MIEFLWSFLLFWNIIDYQIVIGDNIIITFYRIFKIRIIYVLLSRILGVVYTFFFSFLFSVFFPPFFGSRKGRIRPESLVEWISFSRGNTLAMLCKSRHRNHRCRSITRTFDLNVWSKNNIHLMPCSFNETTSRDNRDRHIQIPYVRICFSY